MKIRVGIFFGGTSREREISFAGGRTVFDNLNKALFEPVPIFVDSFKQFILLDWSYIYKGTIRDFYPPVSHLPASKHGFQVYVESLGRLDKATLASIAREVGRPVSLDELAQLMDVAFLALHGAFGEDGQIQGLLEVLGVPYTGSGLRASAIGMDKAFQKKLMEEGGFATPVMEVIHKRDWMAGICSREAILSRVGVPYVVRPANQGSSIGVSIHHTADKLVFEEAVNKAFFIKKVPGVVWNSYGTEERVAFLNELTDIRYGLGFPMQGDMDDSVLYHPNDLWAYLDTHLVADDSEVLLSSFHTEKAVIVEEFLVGREFSCVVIKDENNNPVALPPTEIIKGGEVYDYRSKYLAGLSHKETPIRLPDAEIERVRMACEELLAFFEFNTYARIDGFYTTDGTIYLNDPNTTSGMLPSSFFFHQAAEIGLSPSQFLTYIIRTSLQERVQNSTEHTHWGDLLKRLDSQIDAQKERKSHRTKIAVVLGGYSSERHISVESGRNVFEKLSSSDKYEPLPVFLTGNEQQMALYQLPMNLLLKDNADDIALKIAHFNKHPVVERIKVQCRHLTDKYASAHTIFEPQAVSIEQLAKRVDGVFIALHGRPGEDGKLQSNLSRVGLRYNGSSPQSSALTINKYDTLQLLARHGFTVTRQLLLDKADYNSSVQDSIRQIESQFAYPFIAKPVDDGCSSAVKKLKSTEQLQAYLAAIFRNEGDEIPLQSVQVLHLMPKEEFPAKGQVLIEELITARGAARFLEITGGLLTHHQIDGSTTYEMFEPSEALAGKDILSLEEKFLAGEGQNITPARYSDNPQDYAYIAAQVKATLQKAAEILQVSGYARIDAFVRIFNNQQVETVIVEVNSLPGMTPATCIFHQCALNGYKPYDFIDKILEFGLNE